jgi:hypothetical protein
VNWLAPADNGGSSILSYTVTSSPGGHTATAGGSCTSCSAVVTGLTNGVTYTFTVTATNAIGPSSPSAPSNAVEPIGPPSAPTNVIATAVPDPTTTVGSATVSWTPGASQGDSVSDPAPTFTITPYTQDSSGNFTVAGTPSGPFAASTQTTSKQTITGLVNGTAYEFRVTETNSHGLSSTSALSNPVTQKGQIFSQGFDSGFGVWSHSGLWRATSGCGAIDGTYAYYGNTSCNYGTTTSSGSLISNLASTTPFFSVPKGQNLTMALDSRRQVRTCTSTCSADRTQIWADYNDGRGFANLLYSKTGSDASTNAWECLSNSAGVTSDGPVAGCSTQLAAINSPTGQVRFLFKFDTGTTAPPSTKYGWGVDDIYLSNA